RAVIDRVAREEGAARRLPEADAARRVAGKMQHLEMTIAGVDDAALLDEPRRPGRMQAIARKIVALMRQRGDEGLGDVVAGRAQHRQIVRRKLAAAQRAASAGVAEPIGLEMVNKAVRELEMTADVVGMGVRR